MGARGVGTRGATILAIALLAAGCGSAVTPATSSAPSHAQLIENWRHDHRSAFTTLGKAMTDLGDALVANDWNAIHPDCAKLTETTHVMRDALPTPDEKLTTALTSLVDHIDAAMIECPSLNADSDAIDANRFITNLKLAQDQQTVIGEILK
jgi:PBP1b-binding outer membrane lipoprotein LpoB